MNLGLWLESLPFFPTTASLSDVELAVGVPWQSSSVSRKGTRNLLLSVARSRGLGGEGRKCSV